MNSEHIDKTSVRPNICTGLLTEYFHMLIININQHFSFKHYGQYLHIETHLGHTLT